MDGSSGGLYSKLITRKYDTTTGAVGRPTGFQVGVTGDPDQDYDTTWAYDTVGRLNRVVGPGLDGTYGVAYSRLADSDLVEYTRFKSAGDADLVTVQRQYQSDRDLLDWVENRINGSPDTTVSKYDYILDTLGRRTATVMEGTAFADPHHWDYGYNNRSEVTGGNRRTGTEPGQGTNFSPNGDYDYVYDPIGNRTESNVDGASPAMTYTRNNVNQYTATSDPSESFTHDADGNLAADGTYAFTWDGENRLIQVVTQREGNPQENDRKLEFKYDYMSRRVEKKYSVHNGTAWVVQSQQRFAWDGWNMVLVLDGQQSNSLVRKYTWGLDLSNTVQCGGGVGGLLACIEPQSQGDPRRYWFLYDPESVTLRALYRGVWLTRSYARIQQHAGGMLRRTYSPQTDAHPRTRMRKPISAHGRFCKRYPRVGFHS